MWQELFSAFQSTLFMVFGAGILTLVFGLFLGIVLTMSHHRYLYPSPTLYYGIKMIVNLGRSLPYLVLMIAVIPLTRNWLGNQEGSVVAIIPLTLAAVPVFARQVESALNNISGGLIESAISFGASTPQIIFNILLPEAQPALVKGMATTLVHIVSYSVIAGALGAGGLGYLAVTKGYYIFHADYIIATCILLITLIQFIQLCGHYLSKEYK